MVAPSLPDLTEPLWNEWPLDHFEHTDGDVKVVLDTEQRGNPALTDLCSQAVCDGRRVYIAWRRPWGVILEVVADAVDDNGNQLPLELDDHSSTDGLFEQSFDFLVLADPGTEDADRQLAWYLELKTAAKDLATQTYFQPEGPVEGDRIFIGTEGESPVLCNALSFGVLGAGGATVQQNREDVMGWCTTHFDQLVEGHCTRAGDLQ